MDQKYHENKYKVNKIRYKYEVEYEFLWNLKNYRRDYIYITDRIEIINKFWKKVKMSLMVLSEKIIIRDLLN